MIRAALLFLTLPMMATAQNLPAFYQVTGVASNDVLNIRSDPSSSAPALGGLAANARDVEITHFNDSTTWGRLNMGETSGWVSLSFLERQPENPDYAVARTLRCFGTEPFWSLTLTQGQLAEFFTPEASATIPGAGLLAASQNTPDHYAVGFGSSTAIIRRATCSDRMSDRIFGLDIDLVAIIGGQTTLYSGCCSLIAK